LEYLKFVTQWPPSDTQDCKHSLPQGVTQLQENEAKWFIATIQEHASAVESVQIQREILLSGLDLG
jgi:hypothetical protein